MTVDIGALSSQFLLSVTPLKSKAEQPSLESLMHAGLIDVLCVYIEEYDNYVDISGLF